VGQGFRKPDTTVCQKKHTRKWMRFGTSFPHANSGRRKMPSGSGVSEGVERSRVHQDGHHGKRAQQKEDGEKVKKIDASSIGGTRVKVGCNGKELQTSIRMGPAGRGIFTRWHAERGVNRIA